MEENDLLHNIIVLIWICLLQAKNATFHAMLSACADQFRCPTLAVLLRGLSFTQQTRPVHAKSDFIPHVHGLQSLNDINLFGYPPKD